MKLRRASTLKNLMINPKNMKKLFFISLLVGAFFIFKPQVALATATITGTVTLSGAPLYDMSIVAESVTTGSTVNGDDSDAAGLYSFTVAAGSYVIYNYDYIYPEYNVLYLVSYQQVTVVDGETKTINFALSRRARLIGHVYESDGSTPIYDAYLAFANVLGSSYGSAYDYSTADGSYYLIPYDYNDEAVSKTGVYDLRVTKAGYFGALVEDINLAADNTDYTQNIELTGASTVSGTIEDKNGNALSDTTVTLTETDTNTSYSYSATSDANGNYTISVFNTTDYNGTAEGSYSLQASKSNYITKNTTLEIEDDESTITGQNLTLTKGGKITGKVYKSNGTTPLSGATVTADDSYGNAYTTTSESNGSYSISGLRASSHYIITAVKSGYTTEKIYNTKVSLGKTNSKENFKLNSTKSFSGTIKSKSGTALEGVHVYLYSLNRSRSTDEDYSATTDSDGKFSFSNIVSGKYRMKISKTGYFIYKKESLSITKNLSNKTYKIDPASSLYGKITYNSKGVANAYIYVYGAYQNEDVGYGSASTDNNGYYRINNLKSGSYKVRVITTQYAQKVVDKTIDSGKQETLNIPLSAAGSISGYIFDSETRLPLDSYGIKVKGSPIVAYTDDNGYYILDGLAPGRYKIYVSESLYKPMYYGGTEDATNATWITVTANNDTGGRNFFLKPR